MQQPSDSARPNTPLPQAGAGNAGVQSPRERDAGGSEDTDPAAGSGGTGVVDFPDEDAGGAMDVDASTPQGACPFGDYPNNLDVNGQAQLETLRGCKRIQGSLFIYGDDIDDLSPLAALSEVVGDVWLGAPFGEPIRMGVPRNTALRSLHGLEALRRVRGRLQLLGLAGVTNLEPLADLEVARYVVVEGMDALTDLRGLELVKWNYLEIRRNAKLASLDGLNVPTNPSSIHLWQNPALANLQALRPLQLVDELELQQLPALTSLDGLQNLQPGFGVLRIEHCDALIDLQGLGGFGRAVSIEFNAQLRTLAGATTANNTDVISVADNPKLEDITGIAPAGSGFSIVSLRNLPSLKSLAGLNQPAQIQSVDVTRCDGLKDLTGFNTLQRVDLLVIEGCAGLQSLQGLDALELVTHLRVTNNPALTSLHGLEKVEYLTSLEVSGNGALPNLAGLDRMHGASEVKVVSNAALKNLQGFGLVGSQLLLVESNPVLADLTGLERLENVTQLSIRSNELLTSLRALSSLRAVSEVSIALNPRLPQCEIDWLATQSRTTIDASTNGPPGMCAP